MHGGKEKRLKEHKTRGGRRSKTREPSREEESEARVMISMMQLRWCESIVLLGSFGCVWLKPRLPYADGRKAEDVLRLASVARSLEGGEIALTEEKKIGSDHINKLKQ